MINNFLSTLQGNRGEEWIFNFLLFQFSRYDGKKTRFGENVVQLNWVLGAKALEAWTDSDFKYYHASQLAKKYDIHIPRKKIRQDSKQYYESQRRLFYETERGLLHCTELYLYDQTSKFCKLCMYKSDCSNGCNR